ncbi:hypothetical protein KFL_001740210 [Klebsormidium nitens]|uniref:Uncharacterized protein n=1 Tax=Klebsormidium nitens TaxID=105231 RepID=A0A1Y1I277_KLENI|nr:hypothetical protein KFL_001740210 [Klebsormidium nitens]|eukprot:GAQ84062.1 hypothetical protein KFL_001740210 [Klebsormidium nitens]
MESVQGPFFDAHDRRQPAYLEAPAFTSFERVGVLIPLAERAAADLLAASTCQTERIRKLFRSITALTETFRSFESEQALRNHPAIQHEWLLRVADLMHATRQALFEVICVFGQKERKLQCLSEELEGFQAECLDVARRLLPESTYKRMFQPEQSAFVTHERRSSLLQKTEAFSAIGWPSVKEEIGSEHTWLKNEVSRLCMRVTALEEQLPVKSPDASKVGEGQKVLIDEKTNKQVSRSSGGPSASIRHTPESASTTFQDSATLSTTQFPHLESEPLPRFAKDSAATNSNDSMVRVTSQSRPSSARPAASQLKSKESLSGHRITPESDEASVVSEAEDWKTAGCGPEIFVTQIPPQLPPEIVQSRVQSAFRDFFAGFDALPRGVLDVRGIRSSVEARSGETVAYVELTSLLPAQVVMDASARAPLRVVASVRTLRDHLGIPQKIRIPARQKCAPAPPARAEMEAVRALEDTVRAWEPRRCAYARALRAEGDLCSLVREKVRAYAGAAWELEVLAVGRHACVRFPSAAAADEFFDRPRTRFDTEWDHELFICRHRNYLPMPDLYFGPLLSQTLKPQQVSPRPEAKTPTPKTPNLSGCEGTTPTTPTTPNLPEYEAPDLAGAWNYDLYVAETAERARPPIASDRAETRLEDRKGAIPKEEKLSERREGGEQTEGMLLARNETQERPANGFRNGIRAGTRRGSDVSLSASDVSSAGVLVGDKREGPAAQWGDHLQQPLGFEEEIVPPSSISKATVRVRSEGRNGETSERRNEVTGGASTKGTGGDTAERKAVGGPASSNETGVTVRNESGRQATDKLLDLEDEEFNERGRCVDYEDPYDSAAGLTESGASWVVDSMEPFDDLPDGFETERGGVRTGGSWGELDRTESLGRNEEPGAKIERPFSSPGSFFGARESQTICTNGKSSEWSVRATMQSEEPTGDSAGRAVAGPPGKPGAAQRRVYAPSQFELSPELLREGVGLSKSGECSKPGTYVPSWRKDEAEIDTADL